jgi:hypothetical protein
MDGTTDEIVRRVSQDRVFRFNVDLWKDYEIRVDHQGFTLADPAGRSCDSQEVRAAYLRKPTFDDPLTIMEGGCPEAWLRSQISYLTQEIYNFCRDAGLVRLVEKGAQQRFGKFSQMRLAAKYFNVPPWVFIKTNNNINFPQPAITKPLTADFIEDYRVLFTRAVDPSTLDQSYPWLLQEQIMADADLTIVYVAGQCFAFTLDRRTFVGVDWRKHINKQELEWQRFHLKPQIKDSIRSFMKDADLEFGRLDFLLTGDTLHFLEVNPNGQWAWLDLNGEEGIFDAIINELMSNWIV